MGNFTKKLQTKQYSHQRMMIIVVDADNEDDHGNLLESFFLPNEELCPISLIVSNTVDLQQINVGGCDDEGEQLKDVKFGKNCEIVKNWKIWLQL